jgi:hypothetical protein
MQNVINVATSIIVVLGVLYSVLQPWISPWLQKKLSPDDYNILQKTIDKTVHWAEQSLVGKSGEEKLEAVKAALDEQGVSWSIQDIEAAVLKMHANGMSYNQAHGVLTVGMQGVLESTDDSNGVLVEHHFHIAAIKIGCYKEQMIRMVRFGS